MNSSKHNLHLQIKAMLSSQEFILTVVLTLLYNVSSYVSFGFYGLERSLTFSVVGFVFCFSCGFFIIFNDQRTKKRYALDIYFILVGIAILVIVSENKTGIVNFNEFTFSLTSGISGMVCMVFYFVGEPQGKINKFITWTIWLLPVIIISAFNSAMNIMVIFVTLISAYLILVFDRIFKEKTVGYVIFILFILTVIILSVIIFYSLRGTFQFDFSNNREAYMESHNTLFTYLIYKTNFVFPAVFIGIQSYFYLYVFIKAFLLKEDNRKISAILITLFLYFNMLFSVFFEIFLGNDNGLKVPFCNIGSSIMGDCMIMLFITSLTYNISDKECFDFFANSIRLIFKQGNKKTKMTVFISYRRETGSDLAMHIHDRLKLKGVNSFFDLESMKAGKFNEQIYEKIEECNNFIIILSKDSLLRCRNEGDWVRLEIAHALKNKKHIIPIMTKDFVFPDELPNDIDDIRNYHGITASNDFFDYVIDKLITMLK